MLCQAIEDRTYQRAKELNLFTTLLVAIKLKSRLSYKIVLKYATHFMFYRKRVRTLLTDELMNFRKIISHEFKCKFFLLHSCTLSNFLDKESWKFISILTNTN
jgi:hypothetical protein